MIVRQINNMNTNIETILVPVIKPYVQLRSAILLHMQHK